MENLFYNISQVLGITIIHSLWQGLIIYIALRLFMLVLPRIPAAIKYRVAYGALTATACWFIYTLFIELSNHNWFSSTPLQISPIALPAVIQAVNSPANKYYFTIAGYMPYLTIIYMVGLVFNTLRLTLAWNSIYRIRQNISNAGFENTVKQLSAKLGLKKKVQAVFSEWIDVPCITGYIKPVILLPVSITCHLSTEEIEAILLHELAHIKRNDYLMNFIQQVMGIVLFFNPFARLVNKLINDERENCCDDTVVRVTGSPFLYAQALLKLEENKNHQWQLALAATGKKYELLNRIERIMKTKTQTVNIRPVLITLLALTCAVSSIAWLNPEIKDGKIALKNPKQTMQRLAAIINPEKPAIVVPAPPPLPPKHNKKHITLKMDVAPNASLNDTAIRNKKYKIVVEDDKGNKTEYNSVNDLPATDKDDFLKDANIGNLKFDFDTAGINALTKKFKQSYKQFDAPEWKQQQKAIMEQSMAMVKKFNSPEWKKQQAAMAKHAAEIGKKFANSPEWKKQQELLAKQSADMAQQFVNSPEWKKNQEDMAKMAADMDKKVNSPEWKKQQEDFAKMGEEFGKKFENNPEWKKQQEELARMGEEFGKKFNNSPEWKAQEKAINKQAMEIAKQVQKMVDKNTKIELKDKIELKEELKKLEAETRKIDKKEKRTEPAPKMDMLERPKTEKTERPEKKEKPEGMEKPENPEKTEQSEVHVN
ncbi:MAG TPA: M56 family metallopeptidase [Mucilaginibacter sp.]|nr:M56 family metallopeptidase [Mucilaginibacter sp.]